MLFDLIVSLTHSFLQFSKETKLRVVLIDASGPPVEQLLNSLPNTDAAAEVPVSVIEKEVPATQKQIRKNGAAAWRL
jgi:hypothetical protein